MRRERRRLCLWWTGCECVFETILTPWSIQNTVLSQKEKFTNLKKSDSRGSTAPEHLIFSRRPVPTAVTERRLKRTKRKNLLTSRRQKNTFGKHWEKQKGFWFRDTAAHNLTYPVWSYANSISRHINIHVSFKEAAFKLTFRWKWHFRTSRVRDQERAGAKKTGPSKSFYTPQGDV